jgi:methyl-accepting chemotaxis protein
VEEIVVGIQFQDSMSQRMDHILEAASDVRSILTLDLETIDDTDEKTERLSYVYSLLDLQTAQLKLIIDELCGVHSKNKLAFARIGKEVERLVQGFSILDDENHQLLSDETKSSLKKYDALVSASTSKKPFVALKTAMKDLYRILLDGRELIKRIVEIISCAAQITAGLEKQTKQVRRIGSETHIMALNAIVKAANLEDSRKTFEVIAQEITSLAGQSNAFVGDVENILESIAALNRHLQAELTRRGTHNEHSIQALNDSVDEITHIYTHYDNSISEAFEHAAQLNDRILQYDDDLKFLPRLAERMTISLNAIETLTQTILTLFTAREKIVPKRN